jgi:excisionase family DNA binding protein
MTPGYLSAKHAAEYLDLSYRAFDQAVRRHGIPHERIGRLRRFTPAALDAALKAMGQRPKLRRAS